MSLFLVLAAPVTVADAVLYSRSRLACRCRTPSKGTQGSAGWAGRSVGKGAQLGFAICSAKVLNSKTHQVDSGTRTHKGVYPLASKGLSIGTPWGGHGGSWYSAVYGPHAKRDGLRRLLPRPGRRPCSSILTRRSRVRFHIVLPACAGYDGSGMWSSWTEKPVVSGEVDLQIRNVHQRCFIF